MSRRRRLRPALAGCAALLLAGCASSPPLGSQDGSQAATLPGNPGAAPGGDETGAGVILPGDPPTAGATAALVTLSRDQRADGDLGGAAATIERALGIAPDEALLWVELAEIRRDQGDRALAEEMARKALTLTGENTALAERARRLIR